MSDLRKQIEAAIRHSLPLRRSTGEIADAVMAVLRGQEPMVTKRKSGLILHAGWDPLPVGTKLYAAPMPPSIDAHELWAAAQLSPGEGIEDGVDRIAALLTSAPKPEDV